MGKVWQKGMRKRLDILVAERGLAPSREKAKALIMAGSIYVNGQKEDKVGSMFEENCDIVFQGKKLPYVSRGGLKLEKALQVFPINLSGTVCVDIGASTGGFTDCMLQNGAEKVYAIDCGYGQLAYTLRQDERVINMERTNIRNVVPENLSEKADFASVDVSFISLKHVFPVMYTLLKEGGYAVCLIKPQFEAGRDKVGKKGVVKDKATHVQVIESVIHMAEENGFRVLGLDYSPVKGPEGNIEYLLYLDTAKQKENTEQAGFYPEGGISGLVEQSHLALDT